MLRDLGDPQLNYPTIHIAGTNGKGSTAAMLSACLQAHGLKVGLFTSPHLNRFSERIRISDVEIAPQALAALVDRVIELGPTATYFEVATSVAFAYFSMKRVDVAVVETGLGGRFDATNIVSPIATVITHIGLDHTAVLGGTLALVAAEKAGIIKRGVPVVVAHGADEALEVLTNQAAKMNAPCFLQGRDFDLNLNADTGCESGGEPGGLRFTGLSWSGSFPQPRLPGLHQIENASLALATLALLKRIGAVRLEKSLAAEGLVGVRWPGRGERIGRFMLDVAHNPSAARVLAGLVDREMEAAPRALIGVLDDKDLDGILSSLCPSLSAWDFVAVDNPRSADPKRLAEKYGGRAWSCIEDALTTLKGDASPVLITGSVYLVGAARAYLLGDTVDGLKNADPLSLIQPPPAESAP